MRSAAAEGDKVKDSDYFVGITGLQYSFNTKNLTGGQLTLRSVKEKQQRANIVFVNGKPKLSKPLTKEWIGVGYDQQEFAMIVHNKVIVKSSLLQ